MAAGPPVATTPVDGSAELVADGEHGVYVPVEDSAALADGIVGLPSDPERAGALGARTRERAREGFTVEAVVSAFETVHEDWVEELGTVEREGVRASFTDEMRSRLEDTGYLTD